MCAIALAGEAESEGRADGDQEKERGSGAQNLKAMAANKPACPISERCRMRAHRTAVEIPGDVLAELPYRCITTLRFLAHRNADDVVEVSLKCPCQATGIGGAHPCAITRIRARRDTLARLGRIRVAQQALQLCWCSGTQHRPWKWQAARQQFVQQHPK